MGGQVRISTVGISRLHPPTPPHCLMPGTSPTGQKANLLKVGPEKKPLRLVSRTSLFSPDPSQRGRTQSEGLRQEGFLYVGPGRGVQEPCPVPLIRPSKQRSPFPQGKLRMPVSLY